MIKTIVTVGLATCLLATAANAYTPTSGGRVSINLACVTADDALEIGASIDRNLETVGDMIHDKIVDGSCFLLMGALRRDDATLVKVSESAENTNVWEVRTDTGRTLYVPFDKEPGI